MSHHCNGVFKGGGAKGVAYVGALEACERAGVKFDAVAGSSAGAITAALVATGFQASELRTLMRSALQTIDHPVGALARPGRSSLLANQALRRWLEQALATKLGSASGGGEPSPPCTFAELFARSQIGLYVVAMDLSSRQPIVFSHELTPEMSVADAVVASSAIPVAFPPSLVHIDHDVHRLVDGGAYANYPSFVFDDAAFRRYHGLADCSDTPTLGFVLDEHEDGGAPRMNGALALDTKRFSTDRGAATRELGPIGAVLTSPALRWSLAILPLAFVLVLALWLVREAERGYPLVGSLPARLDPLEDVGLMLVVLGAGTVGLVSLLAALVLVRLGRDALDVGVMGAVAAMGVGPNVPYWFGADDRLGGHIAIRIPVPASLGTLSFRASRRLVDQAIEQGRQATEVRLEPIVGSANSREASPSGRIEAEQPGGSWAPPLAADAQPPRHTPERPSRARRAMSWLRRRPLLRAAGVGFLVYVGGVLVGAIAGWSLAALLSGSLVQGGVLLLVTGLAALVLALSLAARKSRRSRDPFPILGELSSATLAVAAAGGVIATAALLNFALSQDRASIAAVAATDETLATVEHVEGSSSQQFVWVTFSEGFPIEQLRVDARGTLITPCDNLAAQTVDYKREQIEAGASAIGDVTWSGSCLIFDRDDGGLDKGERVTVLYDLNRQLALLEIDRWSDGFLAGPAIVAVLSLEFLATSYHAVRALQWRCRDQRIRQELARSS